MGRKMLYYESENMNIFNVSQEKDIDKIAEYLKTKLKEEMQTENYQENECEIQVNIIIGITTFC